MVNQDQAVNVQMFSGESASATEASESSEATTEDSDTESESSVRKRNQYVMYLTDDRQGELNQYFDRFNARQVINDAPKAEKNKHFHEALIEVALENDEQLDEAIRDRIER